MKKNKKGATGGREGGVKLTDLRLWRRHCQDMSPSKRNGRRRVCCVVRALNGATEHFSRVWLDKQQAKSMHGKSEAKEQRE